MFNFLCFLKKNQNVLLKKGGGEGVLFRSRSFEQVLTKFIYISFCRNGSF